MRRTSCLRGLEKSACKRVRRLRDVAAVLPVGHSIRSVEIHTAYVIIEALNAWVNFVRAYYLSAMLGAKRIGPGRITVNHIFPDENSAIGEAVLHWRPHATAKSDGSWDRREEPTWHDPAFVLPICASQGFSNLADLQAAVSTGTRVFRDLPVFRNYFAHRNRKTREAVVALAAVYGIPSTTRPSEIVLARALGRPQSLILDWLDDLRFTMEYICH